MSKGILTYDDLLLIAQLIKSAESFAEFHVKIGDIEIDLRKTSSSAAIARAGPFTEATPVPSKDATTASAAEATAGSWPIASTPDASSAASPAAVTAATNARYPEYAAFAPNAVIIRSPMVGTFYCAPEPGAKPFVEVAARVTPEMTVCIIEVMKLMNSIPAGCAGVVTHVLVEDAQLVDVGQILIVIDPEG